MLWVIVTAVVLVAVVTGCDGLWRYDARLVAADSLMHDHPDSALALVQAIELGSLTRERDRAYRDLLLTQGRYRSYVPATSDSDINRALDYYRRHEGEREKLTRAYIYKGAVMEELGLPDTAMTYYKYAEATAAPDDYFDLGYTKMRIGELYQGQYSQDTSALVRLTEAINCFEHLNDSNYVMVCCGIIGSIYGIKMPDSAEYFLSRAIEIAQRTNPSKQYTYKSKLAGIIYYRGDDFSRANHLAMEVFQDGQEFSFDYNYSYYAAMSFLKMGKIDSAKYVLEHVPDPIDAVDTMSLFIIKAEIAQAESDPHEYVINALKYKDIESQIISNKKEKEIVVAEHVFEQNQALNKERNTLKWNNLLKSGLTIVLAIAVCLVALIILAKFKEKQREREHLEMVNYLKQAIKDLQDKIALQEEDMGKASALFKYRIEAFKELFDNVKYKTKTDNKKRSIVTLRNILNELDDHYIAMEVNLSESFWNKIKISVDGEYKGVATFIEKNHPKLSDRDFKIFCLLCTGVTPQIIKRCMNITSARTVSNYRSIIMKKLGYDMKLEDFLKKFINGDIS